jgi:hypothetical protein
MYDGERGMFRYFSLHILSRKCLPIQDERNWALDCAGNTRSRCSYQICRKQDMIPQHLRGEAGILCKENAKPLMDPGGVSGEVRTVVVFQALDTLQKLCNNQAY